MNVTIVIISNDNIIYFKLGIMPWRIDILDHTIFKAPFLVYQTESFIMQVYKAHTD